MHVRACVDELSSNPLLNGSTTDRIYPMFLLPPYHRFCDFCPHWQVINFCRVFKWTGDHPIVRRNGYETSTACARHKPTRRCIAERVLLNFIGVQLCACMRSTFANGVDELRTRFRNRSSPDLIYQWLVVPPYHRYLSTLASNM